LCATDWEGTENAESRQIMKLEGAFQEFLEFAPAAVVGVDDGGLIVSVNQEAEQVFGYARVELIGQPVAWLVPERFRGAHEGQIRGFVSDPRARRMESGLDLFGLRKDGREFPADISLNRVQTDAGNVTITAIRDVTDSRAAERLAAIVESTGDAVYSKSPDGRILTWNAAAERLYGYTAEEAIDGPITLIVPEDRHWEVVEILGRIALGKQVEHYETVRRRKDGRLRAVSLTVSPVPDQRGGVTAASVVARDITDRIAAANRFEQFLEFSPDAVVGVDESGLIVLVNQQAELVFGYARAELIGRPVETLVPERFRSRHEAHRGGYVADPRTRPMGAELDLFGLRNDGSEFPAEISLASIHTDAGSVAITTVRDITDRLAAEHRFEHGREEHRQATIDAERAETARVAAERRLERQEEDHRRAIVTAMLESEEAERSRVAAELHDDTIQVMTAVLVDLDRIRRGDGRGGNPAQVAIVERVRTTLAEATERARRLTFELRPAVLHELGMAPAIGALVDQTGVEIHADVSVRVAAGRFDWPVEELVYRTVQEAVANVRKHSKADRITVKVTHRDDRLFGEVADNGHGFDVAKATNRRTQILHLGLVSMVERVRIAGGNIHIHSQPGQGTRVTFDVPAVPHGVITLHPVSG
jgi:PAS domain S-box-containing protein